MSENRTKFLNSSFDKFVFKISIPSDFDVDDWITANIEKYIKEKNLDRFNFGDYKFYTHNYQFEKFFVSYGFKLTKKCDGVEYEENHIRIELNPNKENFSSLKFIFATLPIKIYSTIHISRFDYAIDYQGLLYPQYFYDKNKRKYQLIYDNCECDTAYLGSFASDVQFRIYNKKKEVLNRLRLKEDELTKEKIQEIKDTENVDISKSLYRVEAQVRKNSVYQVLYEDKNVFETLEGFGLMRTLRNLRNEQKWFLCSLLHEGLHETLKGLDRHNRKKWLDFMREYGIPLEEPSEVWKKFFKVQFALLYKDLEIVIKDTERVPTDLFRRIV